MIVQQVDSTSYSFEPGEEASAESTFHRPQTPYQAIRLLPYNATPAEQDEIVQKYFQPVIVAPSQRPDTLSLPGLKARKMQLSDLPTYKDGFFTGNTYLHPELKVTLSGIPGDPVPYSLRTDVFVTFTLLMSFFVVMFIFSHSLHVLTMQAKNFFYNRNRKQLFTLKSDSEMKNQSFVVLLACFMFSLLFFNYTSEYMTSVFNQIAPYKLLSAYMGIFLLYFFIKYLLYSVFNWTFFPFQKRSQWFNAYNFIILAKSTFTIPLVLLAVYFNLPIATTLTGLVIVIVVSEVLLIFKSKQIFFVYKFGLFHLFLYFCTLEMVPLLFLWKTLVSVNEFLIAYI